MYLNSIIIRSYFKNRNGSKFPTLVINYKKGINAMGSSVNYDLVTIGLEHNLNLKWLGRSTYSITAGSFLNNKKCILWIGIILMVTRHSSRALD